ncbi:MAG: sulfurtransferase [Lysobacteraceae bacterium]|nr:MAG: sulfurtransferase [Xanthomonadaceae bacterium]
MSGWSTLVQAEMLAERLAQMRSGRCATQALRIFDCRFALSEPGAGEAAWREGHVPGAIYAHLDRDLSGAHTPGAGRHPWPHDAVFAAWLARCGVGPETQVIAYDAADGAFAARLWALLRFFGHHDAAVLDGGWARWTALGFPVDTDAPSESEAPTVAHPGSFDRSRLLDASAAGAAVRAGACLIDARASERFRGEVEPIDRIAGHVPGAVNRPYAANLEAGRFKSPQTLSHEFEALIGTRSVDEVVAMCGSGVTACHHLLAMQHAGLPMPKLFTGSWSGWIEDPQRPVATGAG